MSSTAEERRKAKTKRRVRAQRKREERELQRTITALATDDISPNWAFEGMTGRTSGKSMFNFQNIPRTIMANEAQRRNLHKSLLFGQLYGKNMILSEEIKTADLEDRVKSLGWCQAFLEYHPAKKPVEPKALKEDVIVQPKAIDRTLLQKLQAYGRGLRNGLVREKASNGK